MVANPVQRHLVAVLDHALRRLALEQASDRGIHDARRDLKKARAALRLLRPVLGEERYRVENHALRDAARLIAPLRDAKSLVEAFDTFVERAGAALGAGQVRAIRAMLREDLRIARLHLHARSRQVAGCRRIIRQRRNVLARLPLPVDGLPHSLARLYKPARRAQRELRGRPSTEALHEWRKRVKYVRNATEALAPVVGKRAAKASRKVDHIGDVLGDDHDLATLTLVLSARGMTVPELDAGRQLEALIAARRAKIQRRRLGARFFADKPARFVERTLGPKLACRGM